MEHATRRRDRYSSRMASRGLTTYPFTEVPHFVVIPPEQGPLLGQWIRSKHGWSPLLLKSPQVNTQLQDRKRGKYTDVIELMHFTDGSSLMNRYLIESQSVQTLSMDVNSEQVPLPSPASTPSNQGGEVNVKNSRNLDDQLHLQGPNL